MISKWLSWVYCVIAVGLFLGACGDETTPTEDEQPQEVVSSRSYQGHTSDLDTTNFVNVYPAVVGTRLDDCQTCHRGGVFTDDRDRSVTINPCDYCHLRIHPRDDLIEAQPTELVDTLNQYGLDYLAAGRDRDGLRSIGAEDSDGDSHSNSDEVADLKYPGDADSQPGQPSAETVILSRADLEAIGTHSQLCLSNSTRQQFDTYADYTGTVVRDLLISVGVDPDDSGFEGITVIAPDGYMKDFSVEEVNQTYPQADFYAGLDVATLGSDCGFVEYPETLPDNVTGGAPIPGELRLIMGWERDGMDLDTSVLDPTSGKIDGEGPYRIVVPQNIPGPPDRGVEYSPAPGCDDGYDFNDDADHNAGSMVRGVIAVRVNPLPDGVEDFDSRNGGWAYVANGELVVYGYGVSGE